MKKSFFSIVIIFLFSTLTMSGQTVKWLMQPDYDSICYYSKDIFKCSKDNKIQLIDLSGKPLLAMDADSVTDFAEGFALVLNKKGADFQLKGYLDEEHHDFIAVNGNFLTTYYSHFSEGLLAVADEKGRQGYLDTRGHVSIPCNLKKARPFVQGWACVESMKEGTVFIDKEGSYMIVQFHLGKLSIATNFNEKGEALVGYTENGQNDFAVINTSGKTIRNYTNRKHNSCDQSKNRLLQSVMKLPFLIQIFQFFHPMASLAIKTIAKTSSFFHNFHMQDVLLTTAPLWHTMAGMA